MAQAVTPVPDTPLRGGAAPLGVPIDLVEATRRFGSVSALREVSLRIGPSAIFGLVGRNGAGKTTLLRILLGLLPVSGGTVRVGSWDPRYRGTEIRRHTSVLLNPPGLYDRLTAYENLEFVARAWHMSRTLSHERIRAVLDLWNLWERRDDRVVQWSEGMRQQLALAKALLYPSPLVLLDEPTTGLDPEARHHAALILQKHWEQFHPTMVVTSHDLPLIEDFCDTVGILDHGQLRAFGTPTQLRQQTEEVAPTIQATHVSPEILQELAQESRVRAIIEQKDCVKIVAGTPEAVDALLMTVIGAGGHIVEVRTTPSLDDSVRRLLEEPSHD